VAPARGERARLGVPVARARLQMSRNSAMPAPVCALREICVTAPSNSTRGASPSRSILLTMRVTGTPAGTASMASGDAPSTLPSTTKSTRSARPISARARRMPSASTRRRLRAGRPYR